MKRYTLIGADNRPYRSATPGTLGGHRRARVYGSLSCPIATRAIAGGGYVAHRVFFADEAAAVAAGYRPCHACLPARYRAWKDHAALPELTHTVVDSPIGPLLLIADGDALREIRFDDEDVPAGSTAARTGVLAEAADQLAAYAAGTRRTFDLLVRPALGGAFERQVWAAVARIPFGATTTYGAIARQLGAPTAARAVGAANGRNPLPIVVPCHRVVGANGRLTGYAGGLDAKRTLLEHEGALLPMV